MSSRQDTASPKGLETRLSAAEVIELLRLRYDLAVTEVQELGGEVDQNLRVVTDSGDYYLLKASVGDVDADMEWQETVLRRLGEHKNRLPVPALVETLDGQRFLRYSAHGTPFVVRLMSWLPGRMLAEIPEQPESLLVELGEVAARITQSLSDMSGSYRSHAWDLRHADEAVRTALPFVHDREDVAAVRQIMNWFQDVKPLLETLPVGVVHQDLNDFNVLVDVGVDGHLSISGVIDVADALFTARVTEVAIAAAYSMLRKEDPLWAACAVVKGFHSVEPLTDAELRAIFPLAAARLCVNGTVWLERNARDQSSYGKSRMRDTWPAIRRIAQVPPTLAELALRSACGLDSAPVIEAAELQLAVSGQPRRFPVEAETVVPVDLTPSSDLFDDIDWRDANSVSASIRNVLGGRDGRAGVVGHLTSSLVYSRQRAALPSEPASLQLGTAILTRTGANVYVPFEGRIIQSSEDGPVVIEHASGDSGGSRRFWTCWRGVQIAAGVDAFLAAGELLGQVSGAHENAGLGAVVHVQVIGAEDVARMNPPIRIRPSDRHYWELLTADLVDLLTGDVGVASKSSGYVRDEVVALRDLRLARSQRAYYRRPPNFVRGRGVWLYDENGFAYLDAINNVTHVGHANPRVTAAASAQLKKLNTNSRFIYEGIATYAERLVSTLPEPLEVVFLVCTGSEANDLALRMARQVTGRTDVMVIDGAYHGNTAAVMGISPNRYKGPGGRGAPSTTHEVVRPDTYRGPYGREDVEAGLKYAGCVASTAQRLVAEGRPPAAYIAESLMGTAGNIVFPDGYLKGAFEAVRATGGLCISDEVQVGVGRLGSHFWGFEAQGVVPDIVTMGKPLGNGHPIAAVVTTREIADAFDDGVKYFNTFGGNPVSCAVGTTVLDIVQDEGLQARALQVGRYFLDSLTELQKTHELIGDVRGHGLYLGFELVRNRETKEAASQEALILSERMKDAGVIVYPTGAYDNVIKLKPPMVFGEEHVDNFVSVLDRVLTIDPRMKRNFSSSRI